VAAQCIDTPATAAVLGPFIQVTCQPAPPVKNWRIWLEHSFIATCRCWYMVYLYRKVNHKVFIGAVIIH